MVKVGIRIDEEKEAERPQKPLTQEDIHLILSSLDSQLTSDFLGKFFRPGENLIINIKLSF